MSELQESKPSDLRDTASTSVAICKGFFADPGEVILERTDWVNPVGFFMDPTVSLKKSVVRGESFEWYAVRIKRLRLSQQAALLLLQGQPLSSILIPNNRARPPLASGMEPINLGHVLLRVAPWEYWRPVPVLEDVVIAKLGDLPEGISSSEVLAALVQDSAA